MKESFVNALICPYDHSGLNLAVDSKDDVEVREGRLTCLEDDRHQYSVRNGIVYFGTGIDDSLVQKEIKEQTSKRYSDSRLYDSKFIAGFPENLPAIWPNNKNFGPDFRDLISHLTLGYGSRTLDIGTGFCWSSRILSERGGEVVALDVSDRSIDGLGAADTQFKYHNVFFERVFESMTSLPFKNESFHNITFNASFHHTPSLENTLKECYRVLMPGGKVAMVNESFGSLRKELRYALFGKQEEDGAHHDVSYREFGNAAEKLGFSINYYLARHVRDKLSGSKKGMVGLKLLERLPFLAKQLDSGLIILKKSYF